MRFVIIYPGPYFIFDHLSNSVLVLVYVALNVIIFDCTWELMYSKSAEQDAN